MGMKEDYEHVSKTETRKNLAFSHHQSHGLATNILERLVY